MNVALWISQGVLAATFATSGVAKATMSPERMHETQTGTAVYPLPVVRFTAVMEVLAAFGLVLPWLTGIARALTPAAAIGLCIIMVGAMSAHVRLREPHNVAINAVLFGLAMFVAIGRLAELT